MLRSAEFSDGLEVLGFDARPSVEESTQHSCGAFEGSALENVRLPATLKRIECNTFARCLRLRKIRLPDGLEYVGRKCFSKSGIEEIELPASVRVVAGAAFQDCKRLRRAVLNEGLDALGEKWLVDGKEYRGMAFSGSGLERANIPSTLKEIEEETFLDCKNLRSVQFSEGLERIGARAFMWSGVERVALPRSTRTICGWAFAKCGNLRSV